MFIKWLAGSVVALALASPAIAQTTDGGACLLLLGGSIQDTGNPENNDFWFTTNRAVTTDLGQRLKAGGYVLQAKFGKSTSSDASLKLAVRGSTQSGCDEIIQVASVVTSASGSKLDTFGVSIMVMHLDKSMDGGDTLYKVVSDFSRDYMYPATVEAMKTVTMDSIAARAFSDMEASGVLARFKAQQAPTTTPTNQ